MTQEQMRTNIERIRRELEEASAGRYPVPRLMAVTKTHTPEEILPLQGMGITEIGENRGIRMDVLAEVSIAGEEQKGGVPFEETERFLREIAPMEGIRVKGLMTVMPLTEDEAYLDGLFAKMRRLYEDMQDAGIPGTEIEELSMGMSGDYRLAARHGATVVRVGSAIFGPRDYSK